MIFTMNSQDLLEGLNTVTRALSPRSPKQILEGILIDAQHQGIGDQLQGGIVDVSHVAAQHQGGGEHAPECELAVVVRLGAAGRSDQAIAVHADGQHIDVVEAVGSAHAEVRNLGPGD